MSSGKKKKENKNIGYRLWRQRVGMCDAVTE